MERRLWIKTKTDTVYANLYIFLVGPPATGKTVAMRISSKLLRATEELHIAPVSVSGASLNDALNEAVRRVVTFNSVPYLEFNSLIVMPSELSTFMPVYDQVLMANLTSHWDNERFEERKRGGGLKYTIPNPQINLIGGCTPGFLRDFLPTGAWGKGFMSRVIMVYSGEQIRKQIFDEDENEEIQDDEMQQGYKDLLADLNTVLGLTGLMSVAPEARHLVQAWENAGGPPVPNHSKLVHYTGRRTVQLLKLMMIASASRSNDLLITLEDYQTAMGWLLEAEAVMPEIFKDISTGSVDADAIEETYSFVYKQSIGGRQVPERSIVYFLQQRVPAHNVMRIIDLMVRSNMFTKEYDKLGVAHYKATPKHLHSAGL
jgi:hypothetical protein